VSKFKLLIWLSPGGKSLGDDVHHLAEIRDAFQMKVSNSSLRWRK